LESHGEDLRKETGDDELVSHLKRDYREAKLDEATRAILDFSVMVTKESQNVNQTAIDALRGRGWSDEDVLNAVQIIGFFNYYNRMVDALGVQAEDFMPSS
jgi:uncharacterized peroxidase-related enzyme